MCIHQHALIYAGFATLHKQIGAIILLFCTEKKLLFLLGKMLLFCSEDILFLASSFGIVKAWIVDNCCFVCGEKVVFNEGVWLCF